MRSIVLVSIVAVASCGGSGIGAAIDNTPAGPPVSLPASGVGLRPGEAITYAVTIAGLDAGEVAIATGEPGQLGGQRAVIVATRGSVTGVFGLVKYMRADGESTVALDTGLPIGLAGAVDWGGKHFTAEGRFDRGRAEMDWRRGGTLVEQITHDLGNTTIHGAVSATAAVRAWNGTPGERADLRMMGARRLWAIGLVWVGPETIHTDFGRQPAIRIDGVAKVDSGLEVKFSAWMTDDSDRVPLRLVTRSDLGTARFDITSYQPGRVE